MQGDTLSPGSIRTLPVRRLLPKTIRTSLWTIAQPRFLGRDIFPRTTDYPAGQQSELIDELDELISYYRSTIPGVPLFFAICAPCQPFTTVSKKKLTQERADGRKRDQDLLKQAAKFVERFQPELVLSENVRGIGDPRYGGVWGDFQERLQDLGYAIGSKIVCASKFGIPQYRKRSILLAVREEIVREDRFLDASRWELAVPSNDPRLLYGLGAGCYRSPASDQCRHDRS